MQSASTPPRSDLSAMSPHISSTFFTLLSFIFFLRYSQASFDFSYHKGNMSYDSNLKTGVV